MEIPLLLTLAVVLVLFYWVWVVSPRSIQSGREQLLRAQGQASGATFFPEYPSNPVFRFQRVHFLFEASDFDRPTIRVAVPSRSDGEAWNAKLSILMP